MMTGWLLLWITEFVLLSSIRSLEGGGSNSTACDDGCNCWGVDTLFVVDCSYRGLQKPPPNIPDNVTHLNFSNNDFNEISKDVFTSLLEIKLLNLSSNNLRTLEHGIFSDLQNLTNLYLDNNTLSELPDAIIDPGTSIILELKLDNNNLSLISTNLLSKSAKMRNLDLSYNKLKELPEGLFSNMSMLNNLNAAGNQIMTVTRESLKGMGTNVTVLNLFQNNISVLEEDLFSDIVLTDTLDISRNSIEDLPRHLFHTNNVSHTVREIYLNSNKLRIINNLTFSGLTELKTLCLFDNQISVIEVDAFLGIGLQSNIYLFKNKLTDLESCLFNNENISQVHLYSNNISRISETALSGMGNNSLVLLSCENIELFDSVVVEIECINRDYPPSINTTRRTATSLSHSGFKCDEEITGNASCRPCSPGYFGDGRGNCEACPSGGYYQDEIGTLEEDPTKLGCKLCPNGTFVLDGKGTDIDKCEVCPEGTNRSIIAGFRACFCQDKYARVDRFELCALCRTKGVNCSGQDYQYLDRGYYWNWDFDGANITQYQIFAANLRNETKQFDRSTTKYIGDMPKVYKCPREESCENKEDNLSGSCAHGYMGWFCSKCRKNFYSVLSNCFRCPEKFLVFLEYSGIMTLSVAFYLIILWQYKKNRSSAQNERSFMDVVVSRTKIVLGFYQVVGEFFTSLHNVSWAGKLYLIGKVISVIEMNILSIFVHPQCLNEKLVLNPKLEFIIGITVPVVILLAPFTFYCAYKVYLHYGHRRADPQTTTIMTSQLEVIKSRLLTYVVAALFVTYPPICTIVFQLYPRACQRFCWDKKEKHCVTVLRADNDIPCEGLEVYQYSAVLATVAYVVAFPAVMLFLLWKFRQLPASNTETSRPSASITTEEGDGDEICPLLQREDREEPDARPEFPVWLNFLSENYKTEFWFWETVELTRKVTQTMLITLLGWDHKITTLITISISVLFLTLHARYMPMRNTFDQSLQMFSLTAILINVVVASVEAPEGYEGDISLFLILLNVVVLVIITVEVILGVFRHLKKLQMHTRMANFVVATFQNIRRKVRRSEQSTSLLVEDSS